MGVRWPLPHPSRVDEVLRYWLGWWRGSKGSGPYRRDAVRWWLTLGWLRR